jgi:nuclear GTP-binding protein
VPFKEEIINEMEAEFQMMKSMREAKKKEEVNGVYQFNQEVKSKVLKNEEDPEKAKYGGLTKEEFEEAQQLIDPEGVQAANVATISKKGFWREVKRVIEVSDVVIEVLDARDPEGSRCLEVEQLIQEKDKKLILIINKMDLVPAEVAESWQKHYKKVGLQSINFKANNLIKKDQEDDEVQQKQRQSIEKLSTILQKYQKKFLEKKGQETLAVGVVGFSNAGKSSLINQLINKSILPTSSQPFLTKAAKEMKLTPSIFLVDTPAIVKVETVITGIQQVRSALQVDEIENPIQASEDILNKVEKVELLRHYRIGNFEDITGLLEQIALKK